MKAEYWDERPMPLSHSAFAGTLTVPDSQDELGRPEPYDPNSHPGQRIFLSAVDGAYDRPGHKFRIFVLIGDAQGAGKSWLLQQIAFHAMVERGQNCIYGLPTRDLSGDIWSLKLRPAIEGAGLGGYLPHSGPTVRGGSKPRFVPFERINGKGGGTLVFMAAGGRGQSGQAALTARDLLVDEVDDWPPQALQLIQKRISKFNATARQFYACTINKNNNPNLEEDDSRIVPLYNESTKGFLEYPCPHCAAFTRFSRTNFRFEGTTPEEWAASARLYCTACGAAITDEGRLASFAGARLGMENTKVGIFGLRLSCFDCPWKSLNWIAENEYRALVAIDRGDYVPMRQQYNKEYSEQYLEDLKAAELSEQISPEYLMRRSMSSQWGPSTHLTDRDAETKPTYSYHSAPMPDEATYTIATIDISANRCYWELGAGAPDGRSWCAAWGYHHFDSLQEELNKQQLHAVLSRIDALTESISGEKPRVLAAVDANFRTDDVHEWLRFNRKWWPIYGASAAKAAKMAGLDGDKAGDYPGILYLRRPKGWTLPQSACHIDTHPMRQAAQRTFLIAEGQPQACHLPSGLHNTASDRIFFQHLCGEMWDEAKMRWVVPKGAGRHDWLDTHTYFMALHRFHLLRHNRRGPVRKFGKVGTA